MPWTSTDSNLHPYFLPETQTLPLCPFLLPNMTGLCSTNRHEYPELSMLPPYPTLLSHVQPCPSEGHRNLPSYSGQVPGDQPHFPCSSQMAKSSPEVSFLNPGSKTCIPLMSFFPLAPLPCRYDTRFSPGEPARSPNPALSFHSAQTHPPQGQQENLLKCK